MKFVAPLLVAAGFLAGCGVTPKGGVTASVPAAAKAASDTTFGAEPPAATVIPAATRLQPVLETTQKAQMSAPGESPTSSDQPTHCCPPDGSYEADRTDVAGKLRIDYRGEKAPFLCYLTATSNGVTRNLVGIAGIPGYEYINDTEVADTFQRALKAPVGSVFYVPFYIHQTSGALTNEFRINGILTVLPTTKETWEGQSKEGVNLQVQGKTLNGRGAIYLGVWIRENNYLTLLRYTSDTTGAQPTFKDLRRINQVDLGNTSR